MLHAEETSVATEHEVVHGQEHAEEHEEEHAEEHEEHVAHEFEEDLQHQSTSDISFTRPGGKTSCPPLRLKMNRWLEGRARRCSRGQAIQCLDS